MAAPMEVIHSASETGYLRLLAEILDHGAVKTDRTGTGTRSLFGRQLRFDLRHSFPLLTTKKVHFKSVVSELLWFIRGETNAKSLQAENCHIWDEWADADGELGPVYGKQWRSWAGPDGAVYDQLAAVIERIKTHPDCRRLLVSAWNVADLPQMALMPCHVLFQFYVVSGELSCQVYMRSADVFLGVPFNISSYALLTHMVAQQCGLRVGDLVSTFGDVHLYSNHVEQALEQLSRAIRTPPTLSLQPAEGIEAYTADHIEVRGYNPHPPIKAPVAV